MPRLSLRHLACLVALVLAVGLVPPALAQVPDPAHCTYDNLLVGSPNGTIPPDCNGNGGFDITIRDANNQPVFGCTVTLNMVTSGPVLELYTTQSQGTTINCASQTISKQAGASNTVKVVPRFGRWIDTPSINVYVNGIQMLNPVLARSPDYDGDGQVGLSDLSIFAADFEDPNTLHPRSQFDGCTGVGLADFSYFAEQFLSHPAQPATVCP